MKMMMTVMILMMNMMMTRLWRDKSLWCSTDITDEAIIWREEQNLTTLFDLCASLMTLVPS